MEITKKYSTNFFDEEEGIKYMANGKTCIIIFDTFNKRYFKYIGDLSNTKLLSISSMNNNRKKRIDIDSDGSIE